MSIEQDIRSISWLKARAADMLDQVNRTRRPVVITQKGKARAVIQDAGSYEDMRNALILMKILAQGEQDIKAGRVVEHSEVLRVVRKNISERTGK